MTSRGTFGVLFPPTDPLPQPQPTRPAPSPATPHPTLPDCADLLVPDLVGVASPPPDLRWLTPGYRNLPPSSSSSPTADWSSRSAPPAVCPLGSSTFLLEKNGGSPGLAFVSWMRTEVHPPWPRSGAGYGGHSGGCSPSRFPRPKGSSCSDGSSPARTPLMLWSGRLSRRRKSCGPSPPQKHSRMPARLQECAAFTILGDCMHLPREFEVCCSKQHHQPLGTQSVQKGHFYMTQNSPVVSSGSLESGAQDQSGYSSKWEYDCSILDGLLDACKKSVVKEHNRVHLCFKSSKSLKCNLNQVPVLHYLCLDDQKFETSHCHVVLYDVPTACGNHFSLGEDAPCRSKSSFRKPNWINNLECKRLEFDLDPIILGLNCSNAARLSVAQEAATSNSVARFLFASVVFAIVQVTWHSVGILLASISTIVYIFIQVFQKYLSNIYQYFMLQKVFGHSWKNMHLRCCHILYWPIILQDRSLSSTVNVEYAHKAAIQKHMLWSNIVMDLLTGLFLGVVLLLKTEIICSWTFALVHYMTDSVLRSGCVWLMGVPAGFKLNTELAELLGMISLNAIQIYSTLWSIVGGFLRHIIWGLAFSGILLGLTVPVSFFIDVIQLATLHVTLLQWLISLIYSRQIQTVASLWRLFRGRKWNPLRQRLDSYDYTVEQHVVGSLLFTPVLVLLPTTSIFYIFFSMLSTAVICLCILLEITVSIIHSTPYAELIMWVARRQRFPTGLFFHPVMWSSVSAVDGDGLLSTKGYRKTEHLVLGKSEPLVSELCCNYATFGHIIRPHYRKIFNGVALSFCKQLAYGILSGERVPTTLHLQFSLFPWMHLGIRHYWLLCRDSVLSCAPKR
nr:N-acetylglucosaminyl-phosphatidylinositol biosynthetic protein gpi1 isoform X1 [Oryza sativa Japonica Group]